MNEERAKEILLDINKVCKNNMCNDECPFYIKEEDCIFSVIEPYAYDEWVDR